MSGLRGERGITLTSGSGEVAFNFNVGFLCSLKPVGNPVPQQSEHVAGGFVLSIMLDFSGFGGRVVKRERCQHRV
jgi:hypothetical protein